jgi:hypothetical protein
VQRKQIPQKKQTVIKSEKDLGIGGQLDEIKRMYEER